MLCRDTVGGGEQRDEAVARSLQLHESAALNFVLYKNRSVGAFFGFFFFFVFFSSTVAPERSEQR